MQVPLLHFDNGPCPYLDDRKWLVDLFSVTTMAGSYYESLLAEGWRRSGSVFYQNRCTGCSLCYPIRLDAWRIAPSKSQRRVWRRNGDVAVELYPVQYSRRCFELYRAYVMARHADPDGDPAGPTPESYRSFLIESPVETVMSCYYVGTGRDRRMVATGYLDILADGLSSVYLVFDPAYGGRSLGTFSVMKEAEICRRMGLHWYYLGFYVPGSRKMAYKGNFRPSQLAVGGEWQDAETAMIKLPDGTEHRAS